MILEQADVRAAGEMIAEGDACADGRQRKNGNALVERVSLRKKLPHFRSNDTVDGPPVVGIGGHLQDPLRMDDEIRRQRIGRGREIDRMVAVQCKGYPSGVRPSALRQ